MIYYTFFSAVTLFIYFIYVLGEERRQRIHRRISAFSDSDQGSAIHKENPKQPLPFYKRIIYPIFYDLKKSFGKRLSGEKEAKIEIRLLQAGSPLGMNPVDFRLFQFSLLLMLPILSFIIILVSNIRISWAILLFLFSLVLAVLLPHQLLIHKTKERNRQALRELPDVVDLLTVSLEAGLGFDSALSKLISKKTGLLSDEFQRCLEEIRLGKTRREALRSIKDRLLVEELGLLINSILQAEKLGISMVHILRVQSHEIRQQRRQRAEEEAMKAPIKMLFPLVLFIFPSLFIVLLGPALIQFLTALSK